MKRRALLLAVASCLVLALVASAGGGIDLSWNVMASGGGHGESRTQMLDATIGQAVSGVAAFGVTSLCTGFWCPDTPFKLSRDYLPLVLR